MLKQILFGGESGLSTVANAGLALLRIFVGVSLAAAHGLGKMPPSDQFVGGVANLGFPAPDVFRVGGGTRRIFGRRVSRPRTVHQSFEFLRRLHDADRRVRNASERPVSKKGTRAFVSFHRALLSAEGRGRVER